MRTPRKRSLSVPGAWARRRKGLAVPRRQRWAGRHHRGTVPRAAEASKEVGASGSAGVWGFLKMGCGPLSGWYLKETHREALAILEDRHVQKPRIQVHGTQVSRLGLRGMLKPYLVMITGEHCQYLLVPCIKPIQQTKLFQTSSVKQKACQLSIQNTAQDLDKFPTHMLAKKTRFFAAPQQNQRGDKQNILVTVNNSCETIPAAGLPTCIVW